MTQSFCRLLAGMMVVAAMSLTQISCAAVGKNVSIRQDPRDKSLWRMSNGTVELVVDSAKGRVTSYGYKGGRNILWTNEQADNPAYQFGGWKNFGGDKAWPWPQEYWGWPPPEPKNGYDISLSDDGKSLQMTSAALTGFDIKFIRLIELAKGGSTVTFTTYLKPTGTTFGKPLAAWSITQVPTAPRLFVRIPLLSDRQRYMERKSDGFRAQTLGSSVVQLKLEATGGKTFMDADLFAAVYADVVFLQRQVTVAEAGPWAPDQRAQVYIHPEKAANIPPGASYTELEWTAPMAPPTRLDASPLRVIWKLAKSDKVLTDAEVGNWLSQLP